MDLDNDSNDLHAKISQQEEIINKLNKELNDEKTINNRTREYLFILENQISRKDRKIKSLDKKIRAKNKRIKKLKKENDLLKSSTSWKITAPFRKIMRFFKSLIH